VDQHRSPPRDLGVRVGYLHVRQLRLWFLPGGPRGCPGPGPVRALEPGVAPVGCRGVARGAMV